MWASIITAIVLVIFIAAFLIFYFTCSTAEVPFTAYLTTDSFTNITQAIQYNFEKSTTVNLNVFLVNYLNRQLKKKHKWKLNGFLLLLWQLQF